MIAYLESADAVEQTLITAVHGRPDLAAETNHRRARALHAAAMGLGPSGCAAAAGITESLFAGWRRNDPAFDTAVTAASAMAEAHRVAPRGQINAFGLRVLLHSVARGVHLGTATAAVGLSRYHIKRMRQSSLAFNSLLDAAVLRARTRQPGPGSNRRPRHTYAYRLITRTEPGAADTSGEEL